MAIPKTIMITEDTEPVSGTHTSLAFTNVIWWDKCSSSIVNVIFSLLFMYPAGALSSSTVYVPFSRSVNVYDCSLVVNLTTSVPSAFLTTNTAPANGLFVSWSTLLILTTTFLGASSIVILIFLFESLIVNFVSFLLIN